MMKIYTKTVCPKCMGLKLWLDEVGKTEEVTFVNLDHEPESVRDKIYNAGYTVLPILEVEEDVYISDLIEIQKAIQEGLVAK